MVKHFAQDLPAKAAAGMTATQGPINGKAFEQKVSTAAWKTKSFWDIVSRQDHMIQPDRYVAMARTIGAEVTALDTSRVAQQPQPARVAAVILEAVNSAK